MQRIHGTPPAVACQTKTISYCIDRTVDYIEVFCFTPLQLYLNVQHRIIDSKQFSSRKMENDKVEHNQILPSTSLSLLSPQLSLDRKAL